MLVFKTILDSCSLLGHSIAYVIEMVH